MSSLASVQCERTRALTCLCVHGGYVCVVVCGGGGGEGVQFVKIVSVIFVIYLSMKL